jgi:hypothetical protein
LPAVREAELGELQTQARDSFHTSALRRLGYHTADRLAAARNDDSVRYQRLGQSGGEEIARLIVVG